MINFVPVNWLIPAALHHDLLGAFLQAMCASVLCWSSAATCKFGSTSLSLLTRFQIASESIKIYQGDGLEVKFYYMKLILLWDGVKTKFLFELCKRTMDEFITKLWVEWLLNNVLCQKARTQT